MLGELHRVIPDSEYSQADHLFASSKFPNPRSGHRRWASLDVLPEDQVSLRRLEKEPGVFSDPQVAAEVAKVFSKRVSYHLHGFVRVADRVLLQGASILRV